MVSEYSLSKFEFSLFAGKVCDALHYTPCGKYVIYPLGSFVVIKNLTTDKEAFFDGHSNEISCVAVSHDGTRLASGQINFTGVKVCRSNAIIDTITVVHRPMLLFGT